ncbi:putative Ig domain-containing protein [Plantibacter sp. YIM 135249]|uniref:putative Ig domain-containing protein n=1 Tax=Plantibacter sp. YIM 135249 TaxID=3423918 RepID=UPI003D340728
MPLPLRAAVFTPVACRPGAFSAAAVMSLCTALAIGPAAAGSTTASNAPRHLQTGTAESGKSTLGVEVHPTNGLVYVANSEADTVTAIDTTSLATVANVPVARHPVALDVDETTGFIWVASSYGDRIEVIDGATNTVVRSIPVGWSPQDVEVDSTAGRAYVHHSTNSGSIVTVSVTVLDTASYAVLADIPVSAEPTTGLAGSDLAVDESRRRVYVADLATNRVTVIDGSTDAIIDTIAVDQPGSLAMDSSTGTLYIGSYQNKRIIAIDPMSGAELAAFSDTRPAMLTVDEEHGLLYAPHRSVAKDELIVLDATTLEPVDRVELDASPYETAIDPSTQRLFTTKLYSTALTVVTRYHQPKVISAAPPSGTVDVPYSHAITAESFHPVTFTVTGGALPSGLALDATTGVVSGTPTEESAGPVTITVANAGHAAEVNYDVTVNAAPVVPDPHPTPGPAPITPGTPSDAGTVPAKAVNGSLSATGVDGLPIFLGATAVLLLGAAAVVFASIRRSRARRIPASSGATDQAGTIGTAGE